jgi:hypothetical protein
MIREGFRRLSYLVGAAAFCGWVYLFFTVDWLREGELKEIGQAFGVRPVNVAFRLSYLVGGGWIFFSVAAALTRFVDDLKQNRRATVRLAEAPETRFS